MQRGGFNVARLAHSNPDFGSRVERRSAFSVVTTSKAHNTIPICNVHVDTLVFARQKRGLTNDDRTSFAQSVLVDSAIFHDDDEILVGICDEVDVVKGITIDEQQICKCPNFHDAELAGIGIDEA